MGGIISDVRWSLRLIQRRPAFASTVIFTLAMATTALSIALGVATAVLWRPLPFAHPDKLVFVWENTGSGGAIEPARVTGYRFDQWQRGAGSFSSMALFGSVGFLADHGNRAVIVDGVRVSTNYFETLGISPLLGRSFVSSDGEPGARQVVVLSHALWSDWYGRRGDVIGRDIRLGGRPYTIVGVMPGVVFPAWPVNPAIATLDPESRQLWVPIARTPALTSGARAHVYGVVGRLQQGKSMDDAAGELTRMASASDADPHRAMVRPFREQFVRDARLPLHALIGAALAVFLVACTNIAALQGSAIESRRSELAIRAALGAGRLRLVRQFSTEAVILAGSGGALGTLLSALALKRIPELLPPSVPLLTAPAVDSRALVLVAAMTIAAAIALAAWPFARTGGVSPAPRGTLSPARRVVFRALVVIQVALAMALVASAALLQQSLDTVRHQDAGFVIDRVLVGNVTLAGPAYSSPSQVIAAERRLTQELGRIPGASAVAFSYDHPLEANWIDSFTLSGSGSSGDDARDSAELRIVSPTYFDTMGVAIVDGRALTEQDDLDRPGAVVVNQALARRIVDGPVLNRTLRSGAPRSWSDPRVPSEFRIVGIVEDERFKGLEQPSEPAVYMSTRQFPQQQLVMLIRAEVEPSALATAARDTVRAYDPQMPVGKLSSLSSILADQLVTRRTTTQVIDGFAAVALALAALGLYGLLALLLSGRLREIGIRLALGSSPAIEAGRVVRECLVSTAIGVACGLGLALLSGRLLQSLLVGVSTRDVTTLAIVSVTVLGVGAGAALLPAWRAARADPASVLRGEL